MSMTAVTNGGEPVDFGELGRAIQRARPNARLSRSQLARFAGMTAPYIHGLEAGRVKGAPSIPYLRAIADAVHLASQFRGGEPNADRYDLRADLLELAGHEQEAWVDRAIASELRQRATGEEAQSALAGKVVKLQRRDARAAADVESLVDRLLELQAADEDELLDDRPSES